MAGHDIIDSSRRRSGMRICRISCPTVAISWDDWPIYTDLFPFAKAGFWILQSCTNPQSHANSTKPIRETLLVCVYIVKWVHDFSLTRGDSTHTFQSSPGPLRPMLQVNTSCISQEDDIMTVTYRWRETFFHRHFRGLLEFQHGWLHEIQLYRVKHYSEHYPRGINFKSGEEKSPQQAGVTEGVREVTCIRSSGVTIVGLE